MLVVADERAQRIGGERRLPGTGEPEEDRRVAVPADVHRRVHRQDPLVGHEVVHHRERRLLDLTGVLRPDDEDLHPIEVEQDRGLGADALGLGIGLERGDVDDREVRDEALEILERRPPEQVAGEDAGPRRLGVDAQRAPMLRVGPDVQVLAVDRPVGDVRHEPIPEPVVAGLGQGLIDLAPPHLVDAARLAHDELVLGGAPGVLAGSDDQGSMRGDQALAVADGVLVELRGRQVAMARPDGRSRRWLSGRHGLLLAGDPPSHRTSRPAARHRASPGSRLPRSDVADERGFPRASFYPRPPTGVANRLRRWPASGRIALVSHAILSPQPMRSRWPPPAGPPSHHEEGRSWLRRHQGESPARSPVSI